MLRVPTRPSSDSDMPHRAYRRASLPALAATLLVSLFAFPLHRTQAQGTKFHPLAPGVVPGAATHPGAAITNPVPVPAQLSIVTYHNDNARTGVNNRESILTPKTVKKGNFGKLFTRVVDGVIYGQPLYYQNLSIGNIYTSTRSIHNVVFVATANNSVYAFDADSNTGTNSGPLWRVSFNVPGANSNPTSGNDITTLFGFPQTDIQPQVGIVSTPVIDPASQTMYVLVRTTEGSNYVHRIHAIDLTTGADKLLPNFVGETTDGFGDIIPETVAGIGDDPVGDGTIYFDPLYENQRPALALANGILYVAYGAFQNTPPFHGWLFAINAATLDEVGRFCTSPNASNTFNPGDPPLTGAIDMSGSGPAVDASNNVFFTVGDGTFNANQGGTEYGQSVLKVGAANPATGLLPVLDYFSPYNNDFLTANDIDLGRGGVALLPDNLITGIPHTLVTAGQEGKVYLLNRDAMGGVGTTTDNVLASIANAVGPISGTPAVFTGVDANGANFTHVYYHGAGDVMRVFNVSSAAPYLSLVAQGTATFQFPGGLPVVSANNGAGGIVWEVESVQPQNSFGTTAPNAVLHAYDAVTLQELFNSSTLGGLNTFGSYVNYSIPTVANGKVYVTSLAAQAGSNSQTAQGELTVFGIVSQPTGQGNSYLLTGPVFSSAGGGFIQADRTNYFSVIAIDSNGNPFVTKAVLSIILTDGGRSRSLGSVTFDGVNPYLVFPLNIKGSGLFGGGTLHLTDATGNSSQNAFVSVLPQTTAGFDHFALTLPPTATANQYTTLSIVPQTSGNTPVIYNTFISIYDTLPDGTVDTISPAAGAAYELQSGNSGLNSAGNQYPNAFGTGTYPVVFTQAGRHVVMVVDELTGVITTGVINVH